MSRGKKIVLAIVVLFLAAIAAGIIYLRYFYGKDAPPPFELSNGLILLPGAVTRRRPRVRSSVARGAGVAIVVAAALALPVNPAFAAAAKAKAGAACTKVGATAKAGAVTLTCTASGKKKVWTAPVAGSTAGATTTAPAASTAAAGATPAAEKTSSGPEGTYKVSAGSAAGYRVRELFVGGVAKVDAVGRSEAVTGSATLVKSGDNLVAQNVTTTVDMTKLVSDESRRDARMRSQGLETDKFPSATFVAPSVALPAKADSGDPVSFSMNGKLTLHGVTKDVKIDCDAKLKDGVIEIVGKLPIKMGDYSIEPPEIPDFVKADDDGVLEFRLLLKKG